jgi:hypothetical protein
MTWLVLHNTSHSVTTGGDLFDHPTIDQSAFIDLLIAPGIEDCFEAITPVHPLHRVIHDHIVARTRETYMILGGRTHFVAPPPAQGIPPQGQPPINGAGNGAGNGTGNGTGNANGNFNVKDIATLLTDAMKNTSTSRADQEVGDRADDVARMYAIMFAHTEPSADPAALPIIRLAKVSDSFKKLMSKTNTRSAIGEFQRNFTTHLQGLDSDSRQESNTTLPATTFDEPFT